MVGLRTYSEPGQLFKNRPGPARTFALFYPLFYTSLTFGPRPSSPNLDSFHLYYQHVTWDRILTDRHETGRFKTACMVFIETGMITTTTATDSDKEIRANKLEIFREREFRQTATTARFCFRIFSLPFVLFFEKSLGRTLILSKEYDRMKQFKCFSVQGYHHFLFVSFFVLKTFVQDLHPPLLERS